MASVGSVSNCGRGPDCGVCDVSRDVSFVLCDSRGSLGNSCFRLGESAFHIELASKMGRKGAES
jgi:hypothetical protein